MSAAASPGGVVMGHAEALRADLARRPMSPLQIRVIALCVLLNVIDGFDVLAMAFVAPAVARDWSIPPDQLGLLFSAGLAGMGLGALLLSSVADWLGRRRAILMCLPVIAIGMGGSALCQTTLQLGLARLFTGIGIGVLISSVSAIAAEYSSQRRRGLVMGCLAVGFTLGAVLGAAFAAVLIRSSGWQAVFWAGSLATAAMILVAYLWMPESLDFLLTARNAGALGRINRLLSRLGYPPLAALDATVAGNAAAGGNRIFELFRAPLLARTVSMALVFFMVMLSFYFITNWAPKLAADLGASMEQAVSVGLLINLGGIAGGVTTGLAISRFGLLAVSRAVIPAMSLGIGAFAVVAASGPNNAFFHAALGFVMFGTQACIYTLLTTAFPTRVRASAIGLVSTAGRVGSTLGPLFGGFLLASGASPATTCIIVAAPALLATFLIAVDRTDLREAPASL